MKPFESSVLIGDNADKMSFLVQKTGESTAPTALEYGTPSLVASAKDPGEKEADAVRQPSVMSNQSEGVKKAAVPATVKGGNKAGSGSGMQKPPISAQSSMSNTPNDSKKVNENEIYTTNNK